MRLTIIFTFLACLLSACSSEQNASITSFGKISRAPTVENPQEIVVVTYAAPNTYYLNADNQYAGLEYDLAQLFSTKYAPEYRVKFLVVDHLSEVMPALLSGKADIAAAGLPLIKSYPEPVKFSAPYYETKQLLVYNKARHDKPSSVSQIQGQSILLPAEANFSAGLHHLTTAQANLNWPIDSNNNAEVLLTKVATGKLDYTVASEHLVDMMQNFYPNLQEALPVGKTEKIAWVFSPKANTRLIKKVDGFFANIKKDGHLRNLLDRHHGHSERLAESDVRLFIERIDTTLPEYKALFKKAAAQTGLNWRLLAALSYRESHWDTNNTSPTNVRGIMMLTENTAEAMGVSDRLDPHQSIPAGAKYILQLKSMFPKTIPEPDRTYFALASYNIGFSHVQDARALAKRQKLNPNSWADIKRTLVQLSDPQYYSTVKYGYASGGAPVVLVETVRSYQRILEKYEPSAAQILSGAFMAAK